MRIVYMGTPDFAVPCVQVLLEEKHEVVGVFTQPDKPKGRGKQLAMPPVKEAALAAGLTVYQPESLRKPPALALIETLQPDLIVVVAYGKILPKEILEVPPFGCINVHASLLPAYRGAAPIQWAVIHGLKETGITTMYMDEGMDTGDMILKETLTIGPDETWGELHDRLSHLGASVLRKTLELVEKGEVERIPQQNEEATYAPLISKELGEINWADPAETIHNLIRGTAPWPSAYTTYGDRVMKIWKSRVAEPETAGIPGTINRVAKEGIYVQTGRGVLLVTEIQFSGGKRMAVGQYLVGNQLDTGIRLGE